MSSMNGAAAPQALLALTLLLVGVAAAQPPSKDAAVELAKKTLAKKLRSTPDKLEVVSVEAARWAGPAIRCGSTRESEGGPEVSGYDVRLGLGVSTFDVRIGGGKAVFCGFNPPKSPQAGRGEVEESLSAQTEQARSDLAKRLSVTPEEIEILEAISVVWRDSSVGCPKPKMGYMQVLTPGFRVRLRSGHRVYAYHGRRGGAPSLCERPSAVEPLRVEVE
jgi:hypothetical protein